MSGGRRVRGRGSYSGNFQTYELEASTVHTYVGVDDDTESSTVERMQIEATMLFAFNILPLTRYSILQSDIDIPRPHDSRCELHSLRLEKLARVSHFLLTSCRARERFEPMNTNRTRKHVADQ